MAINLSANTKTTGPVSQEVFDPNIGFKSGLEGLARGIGQAGQAAGNLAQKIHTKNDNVSKQLAATNSTAFQTQMDSDFRVLQSTLQNPNASLEQISGAKASVEKYTSFDYSSIDAEGEVPESYYGNSLTLLQARYKAHSADIVVVNQNINQLKAVKEEIAAADYTNQALVNPASSEYVVSSAQGIRKTFTPKLGSIIEGLNDRTASDKLLFAAFQATLTTTLEKLPDLDVAKQTLELGVIKQAILDLPDSANLNPNIENNPVLTKHVNTALAKIAVYEAKLGVAGDKAQSAAHKVSDARIINNLEVVSLASENKADPVTGIYTPTGNSLFSLSEGLVNGLSGEATESDAKKLIKPIVAISARRAQADFTEDDDFLGLAIDTDISYVAASLKSFIETGEYTISPEAFILRGLDGRIISDNTAFLGKADVQKQLVALATEEYDVIKTGLDTGDFSVLSRLSGDYGKAWKTVNDKSVDVNTRAEAWLQLHSITESHRKHPKYRELFSGVQGFAVMPNQGKVSFSEMRSNEKIDYLDEFISLNGSESSVIAAIGSLTSSNKDSSVIGVLAGMRLEGNGTVEKALSYLDTSTDIYSGLPLEVTDEDGKKTLHHSAPSQMYTQIVSLGATTPFGVQRLAAERSRNPALAKMYEDVELGMIASSMLTANPNVNAQALLGKLVRDQKEFVSFMGHTFFSNNGSIIRIPEFDYTNKKQKAIHTSGMSFLDVSTGLTSESRYFGPIYERATKEAFGDALLSQNIPAAGRLQLLEYAKNNPALQGALSGIDIDKKEQIDKYIEGVFASNKFTETHPMVDLSKTHTIDDVEYIVPRFLNNNVYDDLILASGKPFMFPVNKVHDRVYENQVLQPFEELDLNKSEDRQTFNLQQLNKRGFNPSVQSMSTGGFY